MNILYRVHAIERMFERGIGVREVRQALEAGEAIEHYPDGSASPGRLVLSRRGKRALHVVAAEDQVSEVAIIITSYRPDPSRWTSDFKQRRDEVPSL